MLRCGADPRAISRHSNARFARECQSFLQKYGQCECRTSGESGHSDSPVEARNAAGAGARCGPTKMEVWIEVEGARIEALKVAAKLRAGDAESPAIGTN
jgi:hypothetical protein